MNGMAPASRHHVAINAKASNAASALNAAATRSRALTAGCALNSPRNRVRTIRDGDDVVSDMLPNRVLSWEYWRR